MNEATLEHINLTVRDPLLTAQLLCELFDWHIRWQGEAIHGGFSVHVGGKDSYLALYQHEDLAENDTESYFRLQGLNHIGIVVKDLDSTEKRVLERGFKPHSHADYEPGRRFYFRDQDNLEIEIISYETAG